MAIPAAKTDELIGLLNQQLLLRQPDELTLRRVIVEAERILKTVRWDAEVRASTYSTIGMAKFMLGKHSEGRASFQEAFSLHASSVLGMNYVMALRRYGYCSEAYAHAQKLALTYKDDIAVLRDAVALAFSCLQIDKVKLHSDALIRLKADDDYCTSMYETVAGAAFGLLQERLTERLDNFELLFDYIDTAGEVVRERLGYTSGFGINVVDDGSAVMSFQVIASPSEAAEVSYSIAEALLSKFDDSFMDIFTIGCLAAPENDRVG